MRMSSQTRVIIARLLPKDKQARAEVSNPKKKKEMGRKERDRTSEAEFNGKAALDIFTKRKRERLEE